MEKRIRVLHIAQAAGGVERYVQMLLKYLSHDKVENILICSYDYNLNKFSELADGFEQIEMQRTIGIHDLVVVLKVRKLIKRYNPDIVYAHSSKAGAISRIANIGMKNICIYNPHGWAFNMKTSVKKQKIYTLIEKLASPFCDKIICISETERKSALEKKICKEEKIQVIFNGVDIEAYEASEHETIKKADLKIPENAFVIGMVGRLSQQKAPDVFVKAAKRIKDKISKAHFVIVGSGEMEMQVMQLVKQNNLEDSFHITGWVDNPMNYVEVFDVACLLSRWEGFGLVLPEYMMAGKPIVATKVDAIPDIVKDGENGLLVELDDDEGISNAIMKIYQDKQLQDKLVIGGIKSVRFYDAKRVSREHQELFEKIRL